MNHFPESPVRRALWLALLGIACLSLAHPARLRADELKDARSAFAAGQYDDAARLYEKAAGQGYAEGRAGVGLVYLKRHQYAKAQEQFELSQKMDANLALSYYGQGEVLHRQEQCDQAVPKLQRAVELDRKFPEAQLALGDCLTQLKQLEKATTALEPGLNWGTKWRPRF